MNWYYVDAGKQAGPVSDEQFDELRRSGKIADDTLVWREGMPDWLPYRQAGFASSPQAPAPPVASQPAATPARVSPGAVCVECGKMFDVDEMIRHGNVYICANCKPVFLQKLGEGLASGYRSGRRSLPVNADQLMNEITARDYEVNIGHCISRAWNLVKSNFWLTVGATFLIMVCNQAAGFIPFLGVILSLIIQGPLFGGLNILFLKLARGEEATIGDAFAGFSKSFWRLCGTFLLMALLLYVWFVPAVVYVFAMSDGNNSFGLPFWILGGIAFFIVMYLGVAFGLALVLSADLELGPWDALRVSRRIVTRKWLSFFGLFVVAGLINLLGLLACFIGVLATMPIFYAAVVYAYEDIFGVEPAHEPAA